MALHSLQTFCNWLASTSLSQAIQTTEWIIPATQTVHIVAVAAVVTSALMIDLRLFGIRWQDQAVAAITRRFVPFIWWALPILLATGAVLIIAEPARALQNPVFLLKMGLLVAAIGITLACQIPLRKDARFWEVSQGRRRAAQAIAALSIPFWIGIVFAGRWIAYVQG
jgi:predicted permease